MKSVAAILLVLLACLAACQPAPGDRLEPFTLIRGSGVSGWQPGRVTVLCFCAFWCDTWKEQSKRLVSAHGALGESPVDFLTVSIDGRWSEIGEGKTVGSLLLDAGGGLSYKLGIERIPFTLVLDAAGMVRFARQGVVRSADVVQAASEALSGLRRQGMVYLTFDDFPSRGAPGLDDALLDELRAAGVKATFFVIGSHIADAPDVARRAAREGHSLQLHSWSHDAVSPQLARCASALRRVCASAAPPALYRQPGSETPFRLTPEFGVGAKLKLPTVNPYDFARPENGELLRRVLDAAKPGSVILLHAGVRETVDVLPELIASLKRRGLTFGELR